MATISFSTPYASAVTDSLTLPDFAGTINVQGTASSGSGPAVAIQNAYTNATQANFLIGSFFSEMRATSATGGVNNSPYTATTNTFAGSITFRDSSSVALATYSTTELTRAMDANGYVTISNFPPKIPIAAGTISTVVIQTGNKTISLSVGAPGGAADVQFSDRTLVTTQPWRLDGSIKFRIPMTYEYTV